MPKVGKKKFAYTAKGKKAAAKYAKKTCFEIKTGLFNAIEIRDC